MYGNSNSVFHLLSSRPLHKHQDFRSMLAEYLPPPATMIHQCHTITETLCFFHIMSSQQDRQVFSLSLRRRFHICLLERASIPAVGSSRSNISGSVGVMPDRPSAYASFHRKAYGLYVCETSSRSQNSRSSSVLSFICFRGIK